MKSANRWRNCATVLSVLVGAGPSVWAQHSHLNAGALQPVSGSKLYFANGANFITNSGYTLPLKAATSGPFAGVHRGTITFTALPSTENFGGPAFGHAAPGAHLVLQTESVAGPAGGAFLFWENDEGELGTTLTFQIPTGESAGTYRFDLSETDGSPEVDPFGHIHGRSFGATLPGLYRVGFRIVDTSTNGKEGAPLHPPSDVFPMYFQAGVSIAGIALRDGSADVVFAALRPGNYQLESASQPTGPWVPSGEPVAGLDHLVTVTVPASESQFFRLRVEGL